MYSLGMFGGMAKLTHIFWGITKFVGIFGVKIQGQKGAYVADKSASTLSPPPPTHTHRDSEHGASFVRKYI